MKFRYQTTVNRFASAFLLTLAISLSAIFCAVSVRAQPAKPTSVVTTSPTQIKIDSWQREQGLPFETVQSAYQTRDGLLWVGTNGGLARFDGLRFETFEGHSAPKQIFGPIFGFMEDAQGVLWIGHVNGAVRFTNGRFESAFETEITQRRRVWAFAQALDGAVWAATENGLVRWENGVSKLYSVDDGLPTNRLRTLAFDKAGTLWIGTTGGGLVSFDSRKFKVMNPANGFPHAEVRHVLADPNGGVWAATAGAGLVHVQGDAVKVYGVADGLPTNQLTYLARNSVGDLWIGTWGAGISLMRNGRFASISTSAGLAGDHIWSMLVDREGSVWSGTWNNGLSRVSSRVFGLLGKREGLSHDNVRSVIQARDGAMWAATAGGGVNKIIGNQITAFTQKNGLATDESSTLLEARDGAIWMGSYTEGVSRLKDGKIENYGTAKGLPSVDVRVLFEDRVGTLWAGTTSGLARFNGKNFTPVREAGAPKEGIATMLEDRSGVLWIGTAGQGLVRYRDGAFDTLTKRDGLISSWIFSLYEDAAGSLWIGTNGGGMNRYRNGKFSAIRLEDGLWDASAQTILEDRAGYLWMTCNRGFYRIARAELDDFAEGRIPKINAIGFGAGNILRSTTFAGGLQSAGSIDTKGHLWLPSLKGLVIVDPARLPVSEDPPSALLAEVMVNGVSTPIGERVTLPPGSVPLSIRYTASTLLNADRVRFRYLMEGITEKWIDAGQNREAAFPALPHGDYRFRLAASIDGQRWSEAPEALPITVKPRFYQTLWFAALALFAALASVVGAFQLRTRQHHNRQAEMERVVNEKTEALKLANEHLSRLSFADALTGLANRRRLDETLEMEWRRALRLQTPLAVVMIDIDSFKAYNDALGHLAGDQCLVAVADVIRDAANRAGDFAARYGGEEFMIVIPGSDHASATGHAENIRLACENCAIAHPNSPAGPVVTISLGVAAGVPSETQSLATLISQADAALYRAKSEGRNRVC